MATVTPGEENLTSAPLVRTFAVALTASDAGKNVLTIDLRDYERIEFQYVGTIPAGNIGFTGGLKADSLASFATPTWQQETSWTQQTYSAQDARCLPLPFPHSSASCRRLHGPA
jgi:hypothetical protein